MSEVNTNAGFFKEVGNEMKKVSWPNKEQLQEATIVTILVCIVFMLFTVIVDSVFKFVVDFIFSLK